MVCMKVQYNIVCPLKMRMIAHGRIIFYLGDMCQAGYLVYLHI